MPPNRTKQPAQAGQPKQRDANAEARIQAAIVEWVRTVVPDILILAIPNGCLRSKAEAADAVDRHAGRRPDLAVVAHGGRTFFAEVKARCGRLSPAQNALQDVFVALGSPVAVLRSIDDARAAFRAWGIRTGEAAR
jgi:hypothetical protein